MRTQIFLISLYLCFTGISYTQSRDSVLVIVELIDKSFKEGIQNVNTIITVSGNSSIYNSNSKGKIQAYLPNNSTLYYKCSHPVYESINGSKKILLKNISDTLFLNLEMIPIKTRDLNEVVVKAPGVPDTIFESKRLSVADFEIQKDGQLILLTYPKQLRKGSELLLYDGMDVVNSFNVPGVAEELVHDYRGNAHVICKDNVYGIYVSKKDIEIANLNKEYFVKYLAPILDTNHSKMFFTNFSKDYPAFDYYAFDQNDSVYSKIIEIEDELMMELYRSEYKWVDVRTKLWAKNKELETGIDAEIWVGANYFTQSLYYKELYAPLFSKNDTIYVFDYYKDRLFSFDKDGNPLDSIPIYHHYQPKSTGWQKNLIQDKETGEIYAIYEISGFTYIALVNTKTGEIGNKVRLEFRYIDKVSVYDNCAYYIYRPFESTQKKFLYKERLPNKTKEI